MALEHGVRTILCTPTATPPAWLCRTHPGILSVLPDGRTMSFGSRRHYDPSSERYGEYCRRVVEIMANHFGKCEGVFAWQIDNELFGNSSCYSDSMRWSFQLWLKQEYGTTDALNEAWGTVFWSQEYGSFEEVPIPGGNPGLASGEGGHHPSLRLAYARFHSALWHSFCSEQARIPRGINPSWLITTNAYPFRWGDGIDYATLFEDLDLFSFDNYSDSLEEGAFYNDLAPSITPRYWILEQKCASPRGQNLWPPQELGMVLLATQAIDSGVELMSFFRFRQGLFAHEQNHGAILAHDG